MLSAPAPRLTMPRSMQPRDDVDRVLGPDLADLQVGPRGHVGVAAAKMLGQVGHTAELMRIGHAAGKPQPAHERVLRRGDEEQAVKLVEKDVGPLGKLAGRALARISSHISNGFFSRLAFSSATELFAFREKSILHGPLQVFGPGRAVARRSRHTPCAVGVGWISHGKRSVPTTEENVGNPRAAWAASAPATKPCRYCCCSAVNCSVAHCAGSWAVGGQQLHGAVLVRRLPRMRVEMRQRQPVGLVRSAWA